jgi:hypothetical protein
MADVQSFEVDAKLAPINVGPWNCFILIDIQRINFKIVKDKTVMINK